MNETILLVIIIVIALAVGWITTRGVKSQFMRLADVFVYGPFLILTGLLLQDVNIWIRVGLVAFGAGTMSYNLRNYLAKQYVIVHRRRVLGRAETMFRER